MITFAKKKKDSKFIPEVNIGLVGHVDHGKTTLVESLSGKWTDTHSEEIKRGITIRLGYADATFYKYPDDTLGTTEKSVSTFEEGEAIRTVSFVDAPGHGTLMATLLSGTSIMDGALLLVSAEEQVPQPQTAEHLTALDIVGIENIIIVQNKIDAVSHEKVLENYKQIKEFVKGTVAENAPIIPISALQRINIDVLVEAIQENIPTPERKVDEDPLMYVARSFDVNKPSSPSKDLTGGIVGGSIVKGELKIGDEVEIKPGINHEGEWKTLTTKVTGLQKAGENIDTAGPGGLLGVSTTLDPSLVKSDFLAGQVLGKPGKLPSTNDEILLDVHLLDEIAETGEKIEAVNTGEALMLTAGVGKTAGVITSARKGGEEAEVKLKIPICANKGDKIAISRRIGTRWRLIGYGVLK